MALMGSLIRAEGMDQQFRVFPVAEIDRKWCPNCTLSGGLYPRLRRSEYTRAFSRISLSVAAARSSRASGRQRTPRVRHREDAFAHQVGRFRWGEEEPLVIQAGPEPLLPQGFCTRTPYEHWSRPAVLPGLHRLRGGSHLRGRTDAFTP